MKSNTKAKLILVCLGALLSLSFVFDSDIANYPVKLSEDPVNTSTKKLGDIKIAASTANTWTNKTNTSGDKPSKRTYNSMVYDSKNDRTILFGGFISGGQIDDTWVYSYTDNSWTNMTITGDKPSKRDEIAMAYDSTNGRTILFGGCDGTKGLDDTWVYNFTDNTWTNKTNPSGDKPNARYGHSMAYDSKNDRTILFGGWDYSNMKALDDTWVYNYTDNTWTNKTNPSGVKPRPTYYHSIVYDSKNDRTILFGGRVTNPNGNSDQTWVYNYTDNTWTNMTTMSDKPSKRFLHSMVYDSMNDRNILFGGYVGGSMYYADTWDYNFIDNSWTNVTTITGDKPSARYGHSMTYDSKNKRTILFGGEDSTGRLDDTWVYCFADTPSPQLPLAAGDDNDDDDDDTGVVIVVVVIIILASVGGVVVVIIVLIKKGIIDTSKLKRG